MPSPRSYFNQLLVKLASLALALWLLASDAFITPALAQTVATPGLISAAELTTSLDDSYPSATAQWQSTTLPYFESFRARDGSANYVWLRFSLPKAQGTSSLGLFTARHLLNLDVYVNGALLYSERAQSQHYLGWNMPLLVELQAGTLQQDSNEVVLALKKSSGSSYINALFVEPFALATQRYQRAYFMQVQVAFIACITSVLLGLLCFGLWWIRRASKEFLYLACSFFAWGFGMFYMYRAEPLWPDWESWNAFANYCFGLSSIAMLAFIGRAVSMRFKQWLQPLLALVTVGFITAYLLPINVGYSLAYLLNLFVVTANVFVAVKVAMLLFKNRNNSAAWVVISAFSVLLLFSGIDMLRYYRAVQSGSGFNYTTLTQFSFVISLSVLFTHLISRYWNALADSEKMNTELVSRIRQATHELEQNLAEQHQQALQQKTLEERQKIYRDLHDDVGAKLTSILHSAEGSNQKQMARAALDSLRETIHHANYHGQSLAELLSTAIEEMQIRLQAAGLSFTASTNTLGKQRLLNSQESYHLTRALRELINNVLHHAKATHVQFTVFEDSQRGFVLQLHDNGQGFQPEAANGNGLANIRERLQQIRGSVQWRSVLEKGCRVELSIPLLA
jgi:signal transduction histidine kinase